MTSLLTSVMERPAAKQTLTDQYSYNQDKFTGGERWDEDGVHQLVKLNYCLSIVSGSVTTH